MSLKAFHIFFVAISTLMCLTVGAWGLFVADGAQAAAGRLFGYGGILSAVVLVAYGIWILKKLRRFSYV